MIKVSTEENKIYCETKGSRLMIAAQVVALVRSILKDNPEIVHAAFLLLEEDLSDFDNVDSTKVAILYACLGGDDKNILKLVKVNTND